MSNLTAPKNIEQLDGPNWIGPCPVKANAVIYHGSLLVKTTGDYARVPTAGGEASLIVLGVADLEGYQSDDPNGQGPVSYGTDSREKVDNTGGASGAIHVLARRGVFRFQNKGADLVTEVLVGENCFIDDDHTVRATASGTTAAGTVVRIADDGSNDVFVLIGSYGEAI